MEQPALSPRLAKLLLFLFLSALMVVAGTHFLETVYYCSYGWTAELPLLEESASRWLRPEDSQNVGLIHIAYRFVCALVFLILGYQALALREWARWWLVVMLALDLAAWLAHSAVFLAFSSVLELSRDEILLQVLTVSLEGSLLGLLSQPSARSHFVPRRKRSMMGA
jgi:hypothetical protein